MKWALGVVGVIVLLVVIVLVIGALVPKRHVATTTASYGQSRETVWQVITDFGNHPSWRTGLEKMESLPDRDGRPVFREITKMGPLTYEVVDWKPPVRLVTRIADPDLPFGGSWTWEIRPVEGGCEVTITENGEIYNPFFRFMARFVFGYHATMERYLRDLGKKFGEDIEPRWGT